MCHYLLIYLSRVCVYISHHTLFFLLINTLIYFINISKIILKSFFSIKRIELERREAEARRRRQLEEEEQKRKAKELEEQRRKELAKRQREDRKYSEFYL